MVAFTSVIAVEVVKKWLNSEYILMVDLTGFPHGLDISIISRELASWMTLRFSV